MLMITCQNLIDLRFSPGKKWISEMYDIIYKNIQKYKFKHFSIQNIFYPKVGAYGISKMTLTIIIFTEGVGPPHRFLAISRRF